MRKKIKKIIDLILFLMTGKGAIADKAADEGVIDLSGQGRDKYGK